MLLEGDETIEINEDTKEDTTTDRNDKKTASTKKRKPSKTKRRDTKTQAESKLITEAKDDPANTRTGLKTPPAKENLDSEQMEIQLPAIHKTVRVEEPLQPAIITFPQFENPTSPRAQSPIQRPKSPEKVEQPNEPISIPTNIDEEHFPPLVQQEERLTQDTEVQLIRPISAISSTVDSFAVSPYNDLSSGDVVPTTASSVEEESIPSRAESPMVIPSSHLPFVPEEDESSQNILIDKNVARQAEKIAEKVSWKFLKDIENVRGNRPRRVSRRVSNFSRISEVEKEDTTILEALEGLTRSLR